MKDRQEQFRKHLKWGIYRELKERGLLDDQEFIKLTTTVLEKTSDILPESIGKRGAYGE